MLKEWLTLGQEAEQGSDMLSTHRCMKIVNDIWYIKRSEPRKPAPNEVAD